MMMRTSRWGERNISITQSIVKSGIFSIKLLRFLQVERVWLKHDMYLFGSPQAANEIGSRFTSSMRMEDKP